MSSHQPPGGRPVEQIQAGIRSAEEAVRRSRADLASATNDVNRLAQAIPVVEADVAAFTPQRVAKQAELSALTVQAQTRHRELRGLAAAFSQASGVWGAIAGQAAVDQTTQLEAVRDGEVRGIRERAAQSTEATTRTAVGAAADLAPGYLGLPFASALWNAPDRLPTGEPNPQNRPIDLDAKRCSYIRVGTIDGAPMVPALVPLLNSAGWAVRADGPNFSELMQAVLLRLAAVIPLHRLQIRVFDPSLELKLGSFTPLGDAANGSFGAASARINDFERIIDAAIDSMTEANNAISQVGRANVEEHWAAMGTLDMPYTLLVINAYPRQITEQVQAKLVQIAQTGGKQGVTLIVRHDRDAPPVKDLKPAALLGQLSAVDLAAGIISAAALPNCTVHFEGAPNAGGRNILDPAVKRIGAANKAAAAPTVSLAELIAEIPDKWADGEAEVLNAYYARANRRPLPLRLSVQNPALPHALIGGKTGSGKSNLLLSVIYSLAARYRPDDLELYLLDFKQGVEFATLGPSQHPVTDPRPDWLPHVKVLALESDRTFGLAVLEHLVAEKNRRGALIQGTASSIVEYRASVGPMARIVLVVDEFHVLFDGDDDVAQRAVAALKDLAKQGRSYGVHVVLASQTTSGIRGLQVAGDSIYSQIPNRISLMNEKRESETILEQGNQAAATLAYRGEVIHNENSGALDYNVRGIVAYAEKEYTTRLRRQLWDAAPVKEQPLMFFGAQVAPWNEATIQALADLRATRTVDRYEPYQLWTGLPIRVDARPATFPMSRDVNQALAITGARYETEKGAFDPGAGLVTSALVSLAMQTRPGTRWVVLDGASMTAGGRAAPWLDEVLQLGRAAGNTVDYFGRDDVARYLVESESALLDQRSDADPDIFVILLSPQLVRDWQRKAGSAARVAVPSAVAIPVEMAVEGEGESLGPVMDFGEPLVFPAMGDLNGIAAPATLAVTDQSRTALMALQRLLTEGAPQGVHTIGWWSARSTMIGQLGYNLPGVGTEAVFNLTRTEASDVLGPMFALPEGNPRVIIKSANTVPEVHVAIPFATLTSDVRALLEERL